MQQGANHKTKEIAARAVTASIQKIKYDIEQDNLSVKINKKTPEKKDYACQTIDVQQSSIHNLSRIDVNTASSKNQQSHIFQSKITNRTNKQSNRELNADLSERARQFVLKLRHRKKQIQGKFVLKKMEEQQRKKASSYKKQMEHRVQKQIEKQVRKLRAQKNIQYYKQKQKMYNKSSNSLSPILQRSPSNGQSRSLRKSTLPSIYATQLQQIKQQIKEQPTIRKQMKVSLDKTVLKNNKKRSHTVTDLRDDDGFQILRRNEQAQPRQIKLFDRNQSRRNHRVEFMKNKRNKKQRQENSFFHEEKKNYLMTRNISQDISVYIDKFSNVNQIRSSHRDLSDRNNGLRIMKNNNLEKRLLMRSSTDRKDLQQHQSEEDQ